MVVCGLGAIVQTAQVWRFGSVSASTFIAICISELQESGPAMLSTLIVVAALVQFLFISRLSLLRSLITPVVAGTVLMLSAATVTTIVLGRLPERTARDTRRGRNIVTAPTALRIVGATPQVPRHRHHHGSSHSLGVTKEIRLR